MTQPASFPAVCRFPCQNGGICQRPNACSCPDGWMGRLCEERESPQTLHAMSLNLTLSPDTLPGSCQIRGVTRNWLYWWKELICFGGSKLYWRKELALLVEGTHLLLVGFTGGRSSFGPVVDQTRASGVYLSMSISCRRIGI